MFCVLFDFIYLRFSGVQQTTSTLYETIMLSWLMISVFAVVLLCGASFLLNQKNTAVRSEAY